MNLYKGENKKKKETGKLMRVTVVTRFLLKDNVSKQQFVQKSKNLAIFIGNSQKSPSLDISPSYSQLFEIIWNNQ